MGSPAPPRQALDDLWLERLRAALAKYRHAKSECARATQEQANGVMPRADGQFAVTEALRYETAALAEYKRVLTVFHDLTVNRKVPPAE